MFKSSPYTDIMQKPVLDFLMNTKRQSSLFEYPLFRRNSFNRLYHILPNCFNPYMNLTSFRQYMLRLVFVFSTEILSATFMYMSESNNPYKYAFMTSINCKDRCFWIARDIRYRKVISFNTEEYVSLKSTPGLGGGFSGLCLKTSSYGLVIWSSKSPRRFFGLGLKIKQASVCRLHNKIDGRMQRRGTRIEI
jgi:hypothetical protein